MPINAGTPWRPSRIALYESAANAVIPATQKELMVVSNELPVGIPLYDWGEADTDVGSVMSGFESGRFASR